MILRHGHENQRTVCDFSIRTVADVYKKVMLWQRNRTMPLSNLTRRIEIYSGIAQFFLR